MYDLMWCSGVLERFEEKYPVSCQEVNRLYRIDRQAVAQLVASDQKRWRGYKALVKHVAQMRFTYERHYGVAKKRRGNYYTFDKYLKEQIQKRLFPAPFDELDREIVFDP